MDISDAEFCHQSTLRIFRYLNLQKAVSSLMEHLKNYMPLNSILIYSYKKELGAIKIIASNSETQSVKLGSIFMLPKEGIEKIQQGYYNGIKIINRPEKDVIYRETFMPFSGKNISGMQMVLSIESHEIGLVSLGALGRDRYTAEHARRCLLIKEPLSIAVYNTIKYQEVLNLKNTLAEYSRDLETELTRPSGIEIVGENGGLKNTMNKVRHVAGLDSSVLLLGETGVGKEVIANTIHQFSTRNEGPFIKFNCGAIPESLIDSELFGHEKGAFTGAEKIKVGRFERANKGTIFLDEIGELPLSAQIRLLRVLQFGEFERVGGTEVMHTDIRVIAATHKDIAHLVANREFRNDLYYRINVFPIEIPPLRKRKADIPALTAYFTEKKAKELKTGRFLKIAPGAMDRLLNYDWPGNVRELENIVEREIILSDGSPMTFKQLLSADKVDTSDFSANDGDAFFTLNQISDHHIRKALLKSKGKIYGAGGAAELLDINPNTLRSKMKKLNIPFRYGKVEQELLRRQ